MDARCQRWWPVFVALALSIWAAGGVHALTSLGVLPGPRSYAEESQAFEWEMMQRRELAGRQVLLAAESAVLRGQLSQLAVIMAVTTESAREGVLSRWCQLAPSPLEILREEWEPLRYDKGNPLLYRTCNLRIRTSLEGRSLFALLGKLQQWPTIVHVNWVRLEDYTDPQGQVTLDLSVFAQAPQTPDPRRQGT